MNNDFFLKYKYALYILGKLLLLKEKKKCSSLSEIQISQSILYFYLPDLTTLDMPIPFIAESTISCHWRTRLLECCWCVISQCLCSFILQYILLQPFFFFFNDSGFNPSAWCQGTIEWLRAYCTSLYPPHDSLWTKTMCQTLLLGWILSQEAPSTPI